MKFAKKKAFTIVELLLAIALLTALLVTSGAVFKMVAKTHITASATAEIARKLRGITDQLNADFKGLRKDGEIFIVWDPQGADEDGDTVIDTYHRFDRIMFFAGGDFQSYHEQLATGVPVRGNLARVTYMLAEDSYGNKAIQIPPNKRTLARSQHIHTADADLVDVDTSNPLLPRRTVWIDNTPVDPMFPFGPTAIPLTFIKPANNAYEYENLTLDEWLNVMWDEKADMLTIVGDVPVFRATVADGGLAVDTETKPPANVHQLLVEGVGSFSVQGWLEPLGRWFPEVDPDGNRNLTDTDFTVDAGNPNLLDTAVLTPRLVYPWPWDLDPLDPLDAFNPDLVVNFGGWVSYPWQMINRDNFDRIPGLGRALKFTFTLYDSRGVFKEGKKFTHIVYLDD